MRQQTGVACSFETPGLKGKNTVRSNLTSMFAKIFICTDTMLSQSLDFIGVIGLAFH